MRDYQSATIALKSQPLTPAIVREDLGALGFTALYTVFLKPPLVGGANVVLRPLGIGSILISFGVKAPHRGPSC